MAHFDEPPDVRSHRERGFATRSGQVAIGVITAGVGTMVMLATVSRLTQPSVFSVFAAWWIAATLAIFPLGVFEVLLARLVISDVAAKRSTTWSVGAVTARAGVWVILLATSLVVADHVISGWLFAGSDGLPSLLGLFMVIALCQTLQRGLATGRSSFGTVGLVFAWDGLFRAAFATLAAALQPTRPAVIAGAVCLGSAASVVAVHTRSHGWAARPRLFEPRIRTRLALLLLAGSAGPILINNAAVPWLSANGARALTIGAFSGALTLSRVPIQFSGAVFGPLMNRMSQAVEVGDREASAILNRRALAAASLAAGIFALAFTGLGSLGLEALVGSAYTLPWWTFGCLGLSSSCMLVSLVVQARAAAEQLWAGIAACWIVAAVTFLSSLALPGGLIMRASAAPLSGSAVALLGLVVITRRQVLRHARQPHTPSADR